MSDQLSQSIVAEVRPDSYSYFKIHVKLLGFNLGFGDLNFVGYLVGGTLSGPI